MSKEDFNYRPVKKTCSNCFHCEISYGEAECQWFDDYVDPAFVCDLWKEIE